MGSEETVIRGLSPVKMAVVVVALALLAAHMLQPEGFIGSATYLAAVIGAAVMAWIGTLRHPRETSRIPVLIAAGITANAIGEVIWYVYTWAGLEPDVTVADVGYFLAYVGLAAALMLGTLVRTEVRGARVDPESVIDTLTIIVVSVFIFWHLSVASIVGDTTVSGFTRTVWATYPVLDAILLAMVVRTVMSKRSLAAIGPAFACGVVCWMVADIGYLISDSETVGAFLAAGWMLGAMLMATAAWRRPGVAADPIRDDARPGRAMARLAIATAPILIPVALHYIDDVRGWEGSHLATVISVTVLLGLRVLPEAHCCSNPKVGRADRGPCEPRQRSGSIAGQVCVPGHYEP